MPCIHYTLIIRPHYRVKQSLWKLQCFFHSACIEIKRKHRKNTEIWHFRLSQLANSSKPCKKSLFEDMFKLSAQVFTQAQSILTKLSMALLMEFCGRSSHIVCKSFFSSSTVFGLGILNMLKIYKINFSFNTIHDVTFRQWRHRQSTAFSWGQNIGWTFQHIFRKGHDPLNRSIIYALNVQRCYINEDLKFSQTVCQACSIWLASSLMLCWSNDSTVAVDVEDVFSTTAATAVSPSLATDEVSSVLHSSHQCDFR